MSGAVEQAVILVGGRGSRLGHLVENTPKPLLPVAGRPFLDYWLEFLTAQGVREIILSCGYLAGCFVDRYDQTKMGNASLSCFVEDAPAGTGGVLKLLADRLASRFLLLNGDSFTSVKLAELHDAFAKHSPNCLAALNLVQLTTAAGRYGKVECAANGSITGFGEKQPADTGDLINAGFYLLDRKIATHSTVPASLECDILPQLAKQGKVCGLVNPGRLIDIGTPADYAKAQIILPELIAE
ncbi:MAG: sugar phosphate nucleotidyltransferase [Betaproteobacteria bacterium]|nr:sugar phosphate nucleotidyltransferase [Betaproteobacteria bacterium]